MGSRASTFVVLWVNLFTLVVSVGVAGMGIWLSTRHHNECDKLLTLPVLAIGGFVFLMFIITNNGAGHTVAGQRYKEYRLEDYSHWFQKQLNDKSYWQHLRRCLVKPDYCNSLIKEYKTLEQYKHAKLRPIEAGCCRPPSECGYPARNASYYDLSFNPVSSNKDCQLYKNRRSVKCYNCNSCKAGVAQYLKREWKIAAIFNVIALAVLILLYCVGCYARRNASKAHHCKMAPIHLNLNELDVVHSVL